MVGLHRSGHHFAYRHVWNHRCRRLVTFRKKREKQTQENNLLLPREESTTCLSHLVWGENTYKMSVARSQNQRWRGLVAFIISVAEKTAVWGSQWCHKGRITRLNMTFWSWQPIIIEYMHIFEHVKRRKPSLTAQRMKPSCTFLCLKQQSLYWQLFMRKVHIPSFRLSPEC